MTFCYVVTDVETDGPVPSRNSIRNLGAVAVDPAGAIFDQFHVRLLPRDGAEPDAGTVGWYQKHRPEAWADATRDPQSAEAGFHAYVAWVRGLNLPAIFTAQPLAFDGLWIDSYMRTFFSTTWRDGFRTNEPPFAGGALDVGSFAMGTMGWTAEQCRRQNYPKEWFCGHTGSHQALDDALGLAHVLGEMLRRRKA